MLPPENNDTLHHRSPLIFPLLHFFYVFSYWTYLLFLPPYFQDAGVSEAGIGAYLSLFPLTTLVLIFPLGMLADKISSRSILTTGAIGAALFGPLMLGIENRFYTPAIMVTGGASFALYYVGMNALFFKHVDDKKRGMGTAMFFAGGTLGFGIGPLFGGFLIEQIGSEALFVVGTAGAVAMLIIGLRAPAAPMPEIRFSDYLKDLRQPAAIIVTLAMFVINTHIGFEQMGFALLMEHVVGLAGGEIGIVFTIIAVWMTLWALVAGRLYDGARKPVAVLGASILWSGIFQYLTVYAHDFNSMVGLRLGHSFGDGFFNIITLVLVGIIFPRGRVGGNFGFILMINTSAVFFAHNASGMLMQGGRYGLTFQVSGAIMVAGGLLLLLFLNPIRKTLRLE